VATTSEIDAVRGELTKKRGGRRPRVGISRAQELDIIDIYAHSDRSMHELAKAMGIQPTYPYRVLEKYHIKWRRGASEQTWEEYLAANPEVAYRLGSVDQKLDQIIAATPDPVLLLQPGESTWAIEITECFSVRAAEIDQALAAGKQLRPGARITSVRLQS